MVVGPGAAGRQQGRHAGELGNAHHDRTGAPLVDVGVIHGGIQFNIIRRFQQERSPRRLPVLITQPVAYRNAVHEAVPVLAGDRELGAEPVRDGHIQGTLEISPLELTEGGFDHAAKLPGRPLGSDIDGAADGVAAKQGALGAAQDFYTLDIHHVQHAADRAG